VAYTRGISYRAVQSLTLVAVAAFVGGGYMGLRALAWHHEFDFARAAAGGGVAAAALGAVVGALYLVFGGELRRLQPDWLSLQLGALLGALLYGAYHVSTPLVGASADPGWRLLQGGVDGLLIGAILGMGVAFVSRQPTDLSRAGCIRYIALFVAVLCAAGVALIFGGITNGIGTWAILPLILALRWGVSVYDRQTGRSSGDEQYTPDHQMYDDSSEGW
jgi:hypothetical protein